MNAVDSYDNKAWRNIYKQIDENYFEESNKFTDEYLKLYKRTNIPQDIPNDIKRR